MKRKLKDIVIKEISLVDKPANKKPFLFFKRQGKPDDDEGSLEKASKINITIESDGTAGGTKVVVGKNELKDLQSFSFSMYGSPDGTAPVSCHYTRLIDGENNFKRSETFYLSKGEIVMDKEIEKLLREFFGDDEMEFEKAELNDETITSVREALTIVKQYREDFPADLKKAIGTIAKHAGQGYKQEEKILEKAGAKFSKEVLAKLKAIVAAATALENLLPKEKTEKSEEGVIGELREQIEKLAKAIEGSGTDNKDKDKDKDKESDVAKALSEIAKRLEAVEKGHGIKKSIDGQDTPGAGSEGKKWPSFHAG